MLDKIKEAKVVLKLKELKDESENLASAHSSKVSSNTAAWKEYGSELCAGDMIKQENKILEEKEDVDDDIDLLEKVLAGMEDFSKVERLLA